MRYLIALAFLTPSALHFAESIQLVHHYGSGRGTISPPTVAELIELEEIECLATMVYGEARGESTTGKIAVAYTAKNRATKKSICNIVLAPKQYSIFNNNPALRAAALSLTVEPLQRNSIEEHAWEESKRVAYKVMKSVIPDPTNGATHYLAPKAMAMLGYTYPKWSKVYTMVAVVDNHHFYKKPKH